MSKRTIRYTVIIEGTAEVDYDLPLPEAVSLVEDAISEVYPRGKYPQARWHIEFDNKDSVMIYPGKIVEAKVA